MPSLAETAAAVAAGELTPAEVTESPLDRFPFDRLIRFYELTDIDRALEDSRNGTVLKPVLRMNH